jgi:hypothetical protein
MGLLEEMKSFGKWASAVRAERGFVWIGTCEADPRTPGPPALAWGRTHVGELQVAVLPEAEPWVLKWEEVTDEEWAARYPHARVPAQIPYDHVKDHLDEWVEATLHRLARGRMVNRDELYDAIPDHIEVSDVDAAVERMVAAGKAREWGGGYVAYIDLIGET